jgi:hypothetical protein
MGAARTPRALSPALKRLRRAIGLALRARRQASGLTQVGLAKRARLHPISLVLALGRSRSHQEVWKRALGGAHCQHE